MKITFIWPVFCSCSSDVPQAAGRWRECGAAAASRMGQEGEVEAGQQQIVPFYREQGGAREEERKGERERERERLHVGTNKAVNSRNLLKHF